MEATAEHPAADYRAARAALQVPGYGEVTVLDTVDSTNAWLTDRVRAEGRTPDGAPDAQAPLRAVVTGFQSSGRGRLDRQWVTPPGTAVTFSVACTPVDASGRPWDQELVPWLTLLMAHGVTGAVRDLTGAPAVIKWPNDVLVHERKLCGILASVVLPAGGPGAVPTVVVGAGINVAQAELPVPTATSLRLETAPERELPTRVQVLSAVLERFAALLTRVNHDPARELGPYGTVRGEIEARLGTIGREVSVELPGADRPLTGTATGLGAAGQLLVRTPDGATREFSAGDVVHVRPAAPAPQSAPEGGHA